MTLFSCLQVNDHACIKGAHLGSKIAKNVFRELVLLVFNGSVALHNNSR